MYVQQFMNSQVVTVTPDENISNAMNLMKTKRINRLPVVSKGKLVGIVTDGNLRSAHPSAATTLSKYEMNELLSKITIKEIAVKNVITTTPDTLLEDAALAMREHRIGALPVMEEDRLVGIITQKDIMDAFLDIMGVRSSGKRLVIEVSDKVGVLNEISSVLTGLDLNIINLAVYHMPNRKIQIFCRIDGERVDEAIQMLNDKGFAVTE